jgi:hypothetical protein
MPSLSGATLGPRLALPSSGYRVQLMKVIQYFFHHFREERQTYWFRIDIVEVELMVKCSDCCAFAFLGTHVHPGLAGEVFIF